MICNMSGMAFASPSATPAAARRMENQAKKAGEQEELVEKADFFQHFLAHFDVAELGGVRELQLQLLSSQGDPHQAEHALMEALGETLWQAQRAGRAPDETQYLARARLRLR